MHHVLMYMGQGVIVESTGNKSEYKNQIANDMELFGKQVYEIENGEICSSDTIDRQVVYFGTYLGSPEQKCKHCVLKNFIRQKNANPPKLVISTDVSNLVEINLGRL